jgi:hypothetical protein
MLNKDSIQRLLVSRYNNTRFSLIDLLAPPLF